MLQPLLVRSNRDGKNAPRCHVRGTEAMTDFSEERIAAPIAALPAVPEGWTQTAIELPRARAAIEELAARANVDEAARQAILADLEAALRATGVEPGRALVDTLRARLTAASIMGSLDGRNRD